MTVDLETFETAAAAVDVESRRVSAADAAAAIDEFVVDPAVGVSFDSPVVDLPASVTVDPTPAELEAASTGVTPAAFAVAEYGSVVLPSTPAGSELVSLFVDRHVVVLDEADIVPDMSAAIDRFGTEIPDEYGDAILATGPSATADMGALVVGAHGPSEVRVVVVEG